jgi:hypothetical protein
MRRKILVAAAPAVVLVLWHLAFMAIGVTSLIEDQDLRTDSCGKQYHVFKYAFLNIVFAFFSTVTFFIFPGGGEGARARAVLLIVLHLAFAVWGMLVCQSYTPTCESVLAHKFGAINLYQHICIGHNACFGMLAFLHELCSDRLKGDHTIIFEISRNPYLQLDPSSPNGKNPHGKPDAQFAQSAVQAPLPLPLSGVGGSVGEAPNAQTKQETM